MGSGRLHPGNRPAWACPPQWETDAGVGVATQRESSDPYLERTSPAFRHRHRRDLEP